MDNSKIIGTNIAAKVIRVFDSGFNCETNIGGEKVKTFSTFSMLAKEGNTLTQANIVVGKEVLITKLLENLTAGKDPVATGVLNSSSNSIQSLITEIRNSEKEDIKNYIKKQKVLAAFVDCGNEIESSEDCKNYRTAKKAACNDYMSEDEWDELESYRQELYADDENKDEDYY